MKWECKHIFYVFWVGIWFGVIIPGHSWEQNTTKIFKLYFIYCTFVLKNILMERI